MTKDTCIYCPSQIHPDRGQGDHVIPAAIGRFDGEFIFRRICKDCNTNIGQCEEQLLRCAPESVFRRMTDPNVKRRKRGMAWVGAHGTPPPQFTIDHGDHRELVEGATDNPCDVCAVDQLVIIDKDSREFRIRLFPTMSAQSLRSKVESLNARPPDQMFLHADESTWKQYVTILSEIRPGAKMMERSSTEAGNHQIQGRMDFVVHEAYWRAIAKIGFHYYLLNTRRGLRGDEDAFANIRKFIMTGGDRTLFFSGLTTRFNLPFRKNSDGSTFLPTQWAHLLAADETKTEAVTMVSLFMGPKRLAPAYEINLGQFRSKLVLPSAQWTHAYVYDPKSCDDRYAGRVVTGSSAKLN